MSLGWTPDSVCLGTGTRWPPVFRLAVDPETLSFTGDELTFVATHDGYSDQQVLVTIIFNDKGITRTDVGIAKSGEVDVIFALTDKACRSMVIKHALNSPLFVL